MSQILEPADDANAHRGAMPAGAAPTAQETSSPAQEQRTLSAVQAVAEKLSAATERVASAIHEATNTVEELGKSMQTIASGAEELGKSMQAVASGADDAAEAASKSRTAMNQIEKASDNANAQANEMERLAFLDPVTRLPNRRYVETSLAAALDQFHIHKEPFGLLLIDLDRFKATNDELGHISGDRALREVGKILSGELRAMDIVGRWGGDEFIAVVPRVDSKILRGLAERCCLMVAQTVIPNGSGTPISLSVSIGGTIVLSEDTAVGLIERADRLMYQCKTCGRGRALIDESCPVAETAMKCTV